MKKYDPKIIEGHFDKDAHLEWERLDRTPRGKVQFHIHQYYLRKYIKKGDRVLEIGPGPGRFTIELAKIGARIGVVDIANAQLKMNEEKVREAGYEECIEWRRKLDILDLEGIPDNEFDSTVVFGGPLSYVIEFVNRALDEVIRVTKPGGIILTSVMSCLGTFHHLIRNVFDKWENMGLENFDAIVDTGDVLGKMADQGTHQCHMFRWSEYRDLLSGYPVEILDASAANFLSTGLFNEEYLTELMGDEEKWKMFLKWELDFCREPGAIDGGTHMIVILRTNG
ncbi:MAG: class I SAM-dependent methyltransferase [Candidatus Thorarchaeota archaeon]